MAKDVDLSSKEWTDIVFEGKNKDFGAYTLRATSVKRHNFAVISVLVGLAIILALIIMYMTGVFTRAEDETDINAGQETVTLSSAEDQEEEEEEQTEIEQPEEEVQYEEEVTSTQAVTELLIVQEVDKDKEVKDVEEIKENTAQFGAEDHVGKEDINLQAVKHEVLEEPKPVEKPKDEGPVSIAMVEQKPAFPGGEAAMYKWLSDNMNYPAAAAEEGVSGKVTVQFIVEKDGSITNVHVVRGKHPALDAEAKRVVSKMPKWTPGRNNGQPVRVTYNLPVNFQLKQ
jgi:protein TonB